MILFDVTMNNGAATRFHKVVRCEIRDGAINALVNSYASEDAAALSWQDTYALPVPASLGSIADVEAALVAAGGAFAGGSVIPEAVASLDAAKALLRAQVKAERNRAEWAGVEVTCGRIDSDPDAQRKIAGAVITAMLAGTAFSIEWRMQDNAVVTMDAAALQEAGMLVSEHVAACQTLKNSFDAQINAAGDLAALAAIDVISGWPA